MKSEVVFEGRVFGVRRDRVREPGGAVVTREVVTHSGSVVLLPVFPDGRILLVRQYRHAIGTALWELVAGRIERGETALASARRELVEETGYTVRRMEKLLDVFPTPGFVSERMIVYLAAGLRPGVAQPEGDENIVTRKFSVRELERMIRSGKLRDAKSIAAILYYVRFVRRS